MKLVSHKKMALLNQSLILLLKVVLFCKLSNLKNNVIDDIFHDFFQGRVLF